MTDAGQMSAALCQKFRIREFSRNSPQYTSELPGIMIAHYLVYTYFELYSIFCFTIRNSTEERDGKFKVCFQKNTWYSKLKIPFYLLQVNMIRKCDEASIRLEEYEKDMQLIKIYFDYLTIYINYLVTL